MTYLLKKTCHTAVCSFLVLLVTAHATWADVPATQQHSLAAAVNVARESFLQARLDLRQWELQGLRKLDERGNATWLELARAEVRCEQLKAQLESANRLSEFLNLLGQQIARENGTTDGDTNGIAQSAIALQLPGSIRLVGWLHPASVSEEYSRNYLAQLHADHGRLVAFSTAMLDATGADLERNRKREGSLNTIHANNPNSAELHRAQFELAAAEAEHHFATAVRDRHQAELAHVARRLEQQLATKADDTSDRTAQHPAKNQRSETKNEQLHFIAIHEQGNTPFISADDDDLLQRLTNRVAAAEANAEGQLRAAEILLQRRFIRLEALRSLRANDFSNPAELEHAQRQYAAAKQLVKQIREQRQGLRRQHLVRGGVVNSPTATAAVHLTAHKRAERQPDGLRVNEFLESIPADVFQDGSVVRHLISLYWQTCEAEAEQSFVSHRLAMHREIQQRLEDIARQGPANARELELAILDVQYDEARRQATRERLEILTLEQRRFVRQLQLQIRQGRDSAQPFMFAFAEPAASDVIQRVSTDSVAPLFDRQPAVEPIRLDSHLLQPGLTAAAVRGAGPDPRRTGLHFEPDRFRMAPELLASLSRSHPYPALRSLETDYRHCAGDSLFVRRSIFNESYSSCFAFGIRRIPIGDHSVWRSRTNSFGAPWYLPGSPTNYR